MSSFVELSEEEGAFDGWVEGSDQEAMVAAGENAGESAAAIATEAIGNEPFSLGGLGEVATDVSAKGDGICRVWTGWVGGEGIVHR